MTEKQIKHAQRVRQKLATPITLLNVLKDLGFVSDELVKKALMDTRLTIRIGELLVELGHIENESEFCRAQSATSEEEKAASLAWKSFCWTEIPKKRRRLQRLLKLAEE